MTIDEILQRLQYIPESADFAPFEEALRAAVEQREAITPELIAVLDRATADPISYLNNPDDCLPHIAIYLLAQFRECRAVDAFLRFFSLPDDQSSDSTGDLVTTHGAAVIASVCGGNPVPLRRLALDEDVNEFVREQAIEALVVQAHWGERPREAVVTDLRKLFHTLARPGNPYVWAALVGVVCDFPAPELAPEIRQAYAEGLVDETVVGDVAYVEKELRSPPEGRLDALRERHTRIDAVKECSLWSCFSDDADDIQLGNEQVRADLQNPWHEALEAPWHEPPAQPGRAIATGEQPYLAPAKPGRNDPCPCGSGRKYKKCCALNLPSPTNPTSPAVNDTPALLDRVPGMTAFHLRVPEPGLREIRSIHVLAPDGPVPAGEYAFLELYCEDLACDCRRVLIQVFEREAPETVQATINFGWEPAAFYAAKFRDDPHAVREITEASLDPLNPQARHADDLLDLFRTVLLADPAYVARLERHYEMFKQTLRTRPSPR